MLAHRYALSEAKRGVFGKQAVVKAIRSSMRGMVASVNCNLDNGAFDAWKTLHRHGIDTSENLCQRL